MGLAGTKVYSHRSKDLKVSGREGNSQPAKIKPEVSELNSASVRSNIVDGSESGPTQRPRILLGKRRSDGMVGQERTVQTASQGERMVSGKQSEGRSDAYDDPDDNTNHTPSHSLPKDPKPLLKLKFKKPSIESPNSINREDAMISIKGQRSKRKRPSPYVEKVSKNGDEDAVQSPQDGPVDEIMEANWILMKLGKDAIGKRVEVHQTSDNSWLVSSLSFGMHH